MKEQRLRSISAAEASHSTLEQSSQLRKRRCHPQQTTAKTIPNHSKSNSQNHSKSQTTPKTNPFQTKSNQIRPNHTKSNHNGGARDETDKSKTTRKKTHTAPYGHPQYGRISINHHHSPSAIITGSRYGF